MFLLLFFLPLLNFNLEAYSKDKIFIYKSPPVDFMLLKNIKKFVLFKENIFGLRESDIVEITKFYIPSNRRIRINKRIKSISSDLEHLYLMSVRGIYKLDRGKIKLYKRINFIRELIDFEILKGKFFILTRDRLIKYDPFSNEHKTLIKFENSGYRKIRVKRGYLYLLKSDRIDVFNLNGVFLYSLNYNKERIYSFDVSSMVYILVKRKLLCFKDRKLIKEIYIGEGARDAVLDLSENPIIYFPKEGIKVLPFQHRIDTLEVTSPRDITFDEEGSMYVLTSSDVKVFGKDLKLKHSFGEGMLRNPNSIFYYKKRIYIADTWNNKIRIFDIYGRELLSFGDKDYELDEPMGIRVFNDKIYVVDTYNSNVKVFDLNGNLLKTFGRHPFYSFISLFKSKDVLFAPIDCFVLNNKLFVLERIGNIKIFADVIKSIKNSRADISLKLSSYDGNLYVLGSRWKLIYKVLDKEMVPVLSIFYRNLLIKPYSFYILDGCIFIVDRDNNKIYKVYRDVE